MNKCHGYRCNLPTVRRILMRDVARRECGFTLLELITTMIVVGIMAVVVLPRMDAINEFDAIGYSDQLKAVLRFAQKSALAKRHAVFVDFSANPPTLAYTAGTACATNGTALSYPAPLRTRGTGTAAPSVSGGLTVAWICFDTLGRPFDNGSAALTATATISITGAPAISVEPETGYVH